MNQPCPSSPQPSEPSEPTDRADILARIDADLTAAVAAAAAASAASAANTKPAGDQPDRRSDDRQLCACGCRVALTAASPSMFFASASCQRRWAGRYAHEPQEVYRRPDAATVLMGIDTCRGFTYPRETDGLAGDDTDDADDGSDAGWLADDVDVAEFIADLTADLTAARSAPPPPLPPPARPGWPRGLLSRAVTALRRALRRVRRGGWR